MFLLIFFLLLVTPLSVQASDATPSAQPITETITPTLSPVPTIDPVQELINRYRKDHEYMYEQYKQAYLEYTQKKQVHTKYGTLTTQQEKIDATKKALIARNNALSTYLSTLKVMLDRYKTADPTTTEKYQIEIQKWIDWLNEQNSIVTALNNDEDIKNFASDFTKKYITIRQIIYTSLTVHQSNHKQQNLKDIMTLADTIKTDTNLKMTDTDWTGNLAIKSDLVKSTLNSAYTATQVKQTTNRFNEFYPASKKELTKASQYLLDILSDLKAIILKSK